MARFESEDKMIDEYECLFCVPTYEHGIYRHTSDCPLNEYLAACVECEAEFRQLGPRYVVCSEACYVEYAAIQN